MKTTMFARKTVRMLKANVSLRASVTTQKLASPYERPIQGRRSMCPKASYSRGWMLATLLMS